MEQLSEGKKEQCKNIQKLKHSYDLLNLMFEQSNDMYDKYQQKHEKI